MFRRQNRIDREYEALCLAEAPKDIRLSEAATLLVFARVGIAIDQRNLDEMIERLAAYAEESGYMPDEIQSALVSNEPQLAQEWV